MKLSNRKLAIGIPCDFPFIPASFFYSFVLMEKPDFIFIHADNGPVDTLRNDIVEKALQLEATSLLMCDVDQVYPFNTITKLMAHRLPVVGAKVNRRYPPFDPIMMKLTDEGYQAIDDYKHGDLVSVDATGTGCILYDMKVFKELPYPWFKFQKHPESGMTIGEDIGLCYELKKAGYDIYVDTSVEIGHLATMIITEATHDLYKAMKTKQARESLKVDEQ